MTNLVGHLLLFGTAVCVLLAIPMLVGRWLRPKLPTPEKDAIYECGEDAIGSSQIQFDLRFYVVALLFIVFDVEVAFFFPWAAIYGSSAQLADARLSEPAREELSARLLDIKAANMTANEIISADTAQSLLFTGFFDLLVFFAVLMVGFAYLWSRGDLDWIRAMSQQVRNQEDSPMPPANTAQQAIPQTKGC